MIIYEFLQQIFQLFSKNLPAGTWNASKIEKFQNRIHQQIEELETCLLEDTTLSVKRYFQRITSFLKDKQYSQCSWQAVQMELRTCLIIFDSLMKKHMS
nr:PREDICTED: interferon alpha-4-like [Opisthocomus hoazin]